VAGFLLPFASAGLACVLVLYGFQGPFPFSSFFPFLSVIPLILCLGLICSLKAIPRIHDLGDKDYAYSGLVLNLFFIGIYIYSVIHYLFFLT